MSGARTDDGSGRARVFTMSLRAAVRRDPELREWLTSQIGQTCRARPFASLYTLPKLLEEPSKNAGIISQRQYSARVSTGGGL